MDALLTSLRALSLLPPSPAQLLQLLETQSDPEAAEKETQALARVLSLGSYDPDDDSSDGGGGLGLERELIEDAVTEIIRSFRADLSKMQAAYEGEEQQQANPASMGRATPLQFLKLRHDSAVRQATKAEDLYRGYRPKIVYSGGRSFSSQKELCDLAPVQEAGQIQSGARLDGMCLLARIDSSVMVYVGATFVVTLPAPIGMSLPVSLSHFTSDPSMSSERASKLLPEGTILALKEPYISPHHALRAGGASGGVGIRIDTPTDIVLIAVPGQVTEGTWRHKYLDGVTWPALQAQPVGKAKGKKGKWQEGREVDQTETGSQPTTGSRPEGPFWLREGLHSQNLCDETRSSPGETTPRSNATLEAIQCLLNDGRPGAAWREMMAAESSGVLEASEDQWPARRIAALKGQILYALGAWQESAEQFNASLQYGDRDPQEPTPKLAEKARQRLQEASSGPRPNGETVRDVYFAHLASSTPRIELADWLSPSVTVAQIPNAGRGLVMTEDVSAGTPLLTAKARGSSYPEDASCKHCPIIRCDLGNGVLSTTTQILATTQLVHIMIDRPEIAAEILGLTAGPGTPDSSWVRPDSFDKASAQVRSIDAAFAGHSHERLGPRGEINSLYVDEVLRHNAFGPGVVQKGNGQSASTVRGAEQPDTDHGADKTIDLPAALSRKLALEPPSAFARSTQPHPLPAILNHSCLPNVSSIFLGDIVITRALRDLRAGEEITHEYVRGGLDYAARQSALSKHGFVCACQLCDLDRGDGEERFNSRRQLFAVRAPALYTRSSALLQYGTEKLTSDDRDKHRDIREALQEFEAELNKTYSETRPRLRPEMRGLLEKIAQHAVIEGNTAIAVRYYLLSLCSVNAGLQPDWERVAQGSDQEAEEILMKAISAHLPVALLRVPALHVDEAQRSVWRLAQLLLESDRFADGARVWAQTAYWIHEILIGGGYEVFRDRWGPTSEKEEQTLEWKEAWDLWVAKGFKEDLSNKG
ncbi:unnamed protein product [Jaminaea pallidilutea]